LHHEDNAGVFDDMRENCREEMVLSCFETDGDDVATGHVAGVPVGVDARESEVSLDGVADEAVPGNVFKVGVKEKMNFAAGMGEAAAVVAAERSGPNDGIVSSVHGAEFIKDVGGKSSLLPRSAARIGIRLDRTSS
jgi:hypothetical protein